MTDIAPPNGAPLRVLAGGSRLALQVPLLARSFPDARFVACYREPTASISEMIARWRSGRFVSANLEGWSGDPWSLPLVPHWQRLEGLPLAEVVVRQWIAIAQALLDDLEALDPSVWAVCELTRLLAHPRDELRRISDFVGVRYDQALLSPVELSSRAHMFERPSELTDELLALTETTAARWRELLPGTSARVPRSGSASAAMGAVEPSLFSSHSTSSFIKVLKQLESSLLISTYQSDRLICVRERNGVLNTHFRAFDKPMGLAVKRDRFALATRAEIWDFRDYPAVLGKLEPPGHDACYLPRNRHLTGDAQMHELAYAQGELWGVATKFSCLASFDLDNSFVPRWRPPFVKTVADGDRCHLNGICLVDDEVAYVSALGTTDAPGGWRTHKASGGVVIDVPSGEFVCAGLSMPHSPRMHGGQMYVLESGRGSLDTVDLATGATERLIELPGFTRGLAFAGRYAFIGLSQIRESSTFGDLPITQRLQERVCGIWIVDLHSCRAVGFLRFDGIVQEIFDVQLMHHVRFPEIAEFSSEAATSSFQLP